MLCMDHPNNTTADFFMNMSDTVVVTPIDFVCGNVDFPPNAMYADDWNRTNETVASSCVNFGQTGGQMTQVNATLWNMNGLNDTCGGNFMIWWFQNMPWYSSGAMYADNTPMYSPGPFMFY